MLLQTCTPITSFRDYFSVTNCVGPGRDKLHYHPSVQHICEDPSHGRPPHRADPRPGRLRPRADQCVQRPCVQRAPAQRPGPVHHLQGQCVQLHRD